MVPKRKLLYIGNNLGQHGASPTMADWLPNALETEGFKVLTASNKRNKIIRLLDMVRTTYKNRNEVDFVIIDTYSTWNFYYAVIIAKICRNYKLPYIPILHGGNLPHRLEKDKHLSQNLFNGAKTCVSPSLYLMNQFRDSGFTNLTYIPNTLDINNYPYLPRPQLAPKLLWVRSFAEIYNPLLAMEILEILIKQGVNASLCMVGPDKDGSLIRCKQIAQELNLPVTFTGILSKKEWITLSKNYDLFINTTNFDNMPVSVMEAMALGLPVISTNVGGMPYMIKSGDNGILVPSKSPKAFVEAILELLQNSEESLRMAQAARTEMEKLDWQKIKKLWIELLA
jgi:glycosyltransferase involved in cell wall biosynthesis